MLWMSYLLHPHFTSLLVAAKTVRQHMSLRKCGERIVPKANHRLDAYTTREDMNVLDEYGIGIEPIAEMRGAVKAREFNGQEYWHWPIPSGKSATTSFSLSRIGTMVLTRRPAE